jgi:NADH-quinone oxidoreductase subunit N
LFSILFIFLSLTKQRFHEYRYPEYFALFLFMTAGFQFMASSDNLILILVGLETASMSLYTMIAMHNRDKSTEAAIKYFTMGALAAGFLLTAVRNWTKISTPTGWTLAGLVSTWLLQ